MPPTNDNLETLKAQEYEQRLVVDRLRREVFQQTDPNASESLMDELTEAEDALEEIENRRVDAQKADETSGLILDSQKLGSEGESEPVTRDSSNRRRTRGSGSSGGTRGAATTGLEAKVYLRMAHVPTAIYHLLDGKDSPLVSCTVKATGSSGKARRVRVSTFIEGYSATAVNSAEIELGKEKVFLQLPTLFPDSLKELNELTRAMLNIQVEDLDGKTELHHTEPIWLLARTTAPLAVRDATTGGWTDLTRYFGAFVTPNAPSLMKFLRLAAAQHDGDRLIGYQGGKEEIEPQVKAIFNALKENANITYVNSVIDFNPEQGTSSQRVRLPRESLADQEANCIDGTVLFASLLEGISLNPAIVLVPGHAIVAWETWRGSGEWRFLETTMIGSHSFEEARTSGEKVAQKYKNHSKYKLLPVGELRTRHQITPME